MARAKRQPSANPVQTKTRMEAPSRFKNASSHFVPNTTERGVGNATKWDIHSTPIHKEMWALRLRDMVITKLPQDCQQPLKRNKKISNNMLNE